MFKKVITLLLAVMMSGSILIMDCRTEVYAQGAPAASMSKASKPELTGDSLIGSYRYSGGKISGYCFSDYLKNTGSTGTVTIKVSLQFDGTDYGSKTKTFNARAGKKYAVSIDAGLIAGGKSDKSSVVTLSSANMKNAIQFEVKKTMISSLGEIKVEEINNNANLADLKVYSGKTPVVFDYNGAGSAYVDMKTTVITVIASAEDPEASVTINGQAVRNGSSKVISLKAGNNEIKISVVSPDKKVVNTKVLSVVRASSAASNKWEKSYGYVNALESAGPEVYAIVGDGGNSCISIAPDGKTKKIFSTPEITRLLAVAKDGTFYTRSDTKLYALKPDGKLKWTYTQKDITNLTVGGDGTVYLLAYGGAENKVIALSPAGKKLWETGTRNLSSLFSAGPDNLLLCSASEWNGSEENRRLCAFRADGTKVWEVPVKGDMYDLVTGNDGLIYLAAYQKLLVIDPRGGNVKSEIPLDVNPQKILMAQDGTIYMAADGYGKKTPTEIDGREAFTMEDPFGSLRAYTKEGTIKWEIKSRESFFGIALDPSGGIVASSGDHKLIRVDSKGAKKKEHTLTFIPYLRPVLSSDGSLYYYDEKKIISFGK